MSVISLVNAARNSNAMQSLGRNKPKNCHEAVLGWLLISLNYPQPWDLLRLAAPKGTNPPQFTGSWMGKNIYTATFPVTQNSVVQHQAVGAPREGDILFCGNPGYASHSMVVVYRTALEVKIRGFNNEGTFRGCVPRPVRMEYDAIDRPVHDDKLWKNGFQFGAAGECLFRVRHSDACQRVAELFPYSGSTFRGGAPSPSVLVSLSCRRKAARRTVAMPCRFLLDGLDALRV